MVQHVGYKVVESGRARHVRLTVHLDKGIVVVVPKGFDLKQVPGIINQNRARLERAMKKLLENHQAFFSAVRTSRLPASIAFLAIEQKWSVFYESADSQTLQLSEDTADNSIVLHGDVTDKQACTSMLKAWVKNKAKEELKAMLHEVSLDVGLCYNTVFIRTQKTRWGSCSSMKSINLNRKILYLPQHLAKYILIHELCHTVHVNHAAVFWELVAEKEPKYKELKKELKNALSYIPLWDYF